MGVHIHGIAHPIKKNVKMNRSKETDVVYVVKNLYGDSVFMKQGDTKEFHANNNV